MTILINALGGALFINDAEPRVITQNGGAAPATGDAVSISGGFASSLTVAGIVVASSGTGIDIDGNDTIFVAAPGTVLASGIGGDGILAAGADSDIRVAGSLVASDFGIFGGPDTAGMTVTVTSTGLIQGGSNSAGADNSAFSAAIGLEANATLINHGDIIGDFNPDTGQRIAVLNAEFLNSDPNDLDPTTNAALTFTNGGFVLGNVFFAAGNDIYNGVGDGVVVGAIDMGLGNDTVSGSSAREAILGGGGSDAIVSRGGDDVISGGNASDVILGGSGDDAMSGDNGSDSLAGQRGDDNIDGGDGNDFIAGGIGNDVLVGGARRDSILGGANADTLSGGAGLDTLNGGGGNDIMEGGGNGDRYVFIGRFGSDTINGFSGSNTEKIDLRAVTNITNFNDLVTNHLSQDGADALIDARGGNDIRLLGFTAANLDAGDFIF